MSAKRSIWLWMLAAVLLVAGAACGDDDDDESAATGDEGTEQPSDDAGNTSGDTDDDPGDDAGDSDAGSGEFGTITINGDVYPVTFLNRCIPFSESDDDLDLQALGDGVKINLYGTAGEIDDVSVDGSVVTESYGSPAFGLTELTASSIDGDRTTGSASLEAATDTGETVDVEWDVEIPDEVQDCSL